MTKGKSGPRLGGRYAFVKRRLLQLPQQSCGMEVDYCPLPEIVEGEGGFWLGMVVDHDTGHILETSVLDALPSAEDAADILAGAMERAHPKAPCRPEIALLRDNPTWEPLFPWLEHLGIKIKVTEELRHWDAKAEELVQWMQANWSPLPDFLAGMHEKYGIYGTLSRLNFLTYRFRYFEQEGSP